MVLHSPFAWHVDENVVAPSMSHVKITVVPSEDVPSKLLEVPTGPSGPVLSQNTEMIRAVRKMQIKMHKNTGNYAKEYVNKNLVFWVKKCVIRLTFLPFYPIKMKKIVFQKKISKFS